MIVKLKDFKITCPKTGKVNHSQKRLVDFSMRNLILKSISDGLQIVFCSGAKGSGKSTGVQYIIAMYMLNFPGLTVMIGKLSEVGARKSFFRELKGMLPEDEISISNESEFTLKNGSRAFVKGWQSSIDSLKGLNCNISVIEEFTEDLDTGHIGKNMDAFKEISFRSRDNNLFQIIFILTNPHSPSSDPYKEILNKCGYVDTNKNNSFGRLENYHLFYSKTRDNWHLPPNYYENLQAMLTAKQVERDLEGKWVDVHGDGIYDMYDPDIHLMKELYTVDKTIPVNLSLDFNSQEGKPMSATISQYSNKIYHFYDECVIQGNTKILMEELEARGFFKQFSARTGKFKLKITGDYTGWSKDSTSNFSDFGIITNFLDKLPYYVNYEITAKKTSNPELRLRHNTVNAKLLNSLGQSFIKIYPPLHEPTKIPTLHLGFLSTRLKKGSRYIEQDSNENQHITTAAGYQICENEKELQNQSFIKSF